MTDGGAWSDGAPGSGGGGFDEWRKEMSRRLKGLELRPAWGKSLGKDFGLLKWFGPNWQWAAGKPFPIFESRSWVFSNWILTETKLGKN
jgi:hypothetical protein